MNKINNKSCFNKKNCKQKVLPGTSSSSQSCRQCKAIGKLINLPALAAVVQKKKEANFTIALVINNIKLLFASFTL